MDASNYWDEVKNELKTIWNHGNNEVLKLEFPFGDLAVLTTQTMGL